MCDVCHMSRCPAGCPNALDPPEVFTCGYCKEAISSGEDHIELDGEHYHEECFSDCAETLLFERYGARKCVTEADR